MPHVTSPVSQARSFSTLFLIEMWERFGFYGMQVLMVTYMMKKLGFIDTRANLVWGAASALIYATPAVGGWIGDKLIGTRYCGCPATANTSCTLRSA
jgi:proton-dependent oligopeptide transporter, POT family